MSASRLPRVDVIAARLEGPHALRVAAARQAIASVRARVLAGDEVAVEALITAAKSWIAARARPTLQRVINATGVVVHTNLGRAPLPLEAVLPALGYCNLEYDLATGQRGSRRAAIEPLLTELSGAEAALVVNNAAAALVLSLASLPRSSSAMSEVIVSRGELVEIGGSFRIPEILESAGVHLREVGTTNRTYAADYAHALGPATLAILRVHPSNFRVSGFVARPTIAELRALATTVPLLVDLGSDPLWPIAIADDGDTLADAIQADIVMLSGDKLVGGPQAGVALGTRSAIERMASHPLMRALRPDKLALAALEHVLRARLRSAPEEVPVLAMICGPAATEDALRARAVTLAGRLSRCSPLVVATDDPIGGGSHPETTLRGAGLALSPPPHLGLDDWHRALRTGSPPVIATLADKRLVIALRTVSRADEDDLVRAIDTTLDTAPALI